MSRTVRGERPPGYDYWSRRPGSSNGHGRVVKKVTASKEKTASKRLVRLEIENIKGM